MQHDRRSEAPRLRSAHRQFLDAVLAFSDDPGPENLVPYLAANRDLERSKRSGRTSALALSGAARAA
jgi:hypothetical protein